jgi:hypothetical protein
MFMSVDISIPRKMFWSNEAGGTEFCPECHSPLENDSQTYVLAAEKGRHVDTFIAGNDAGYFCTQCPVVVLDCQEFDEFAAMILGEGHTRFNVLGIVDMDAVPESKQDLPLGDGDNPIPLVKFLNTARFLKEPSKKTSFQKQQKCRKDRKKRKHRK